MPAPETMSTTQEHPRQLGWRVHVCTWTPDQKDDAALVVGWLQNNGCTVLALPTDLIEKKLLAARNCDLCLLLLGKEFAKPDLSSSFSHTELEVSAAADINPDKIVAFACHDVDKAPSAEQREFVQRVQSFPNGTYRGLYKTPDELRISLGNALISWTPPKASAPVQPRPVVSDAVMISSTSDFSGTPDEPKPRDMVRTALVKDMGLHVIDYVYEPSESVTPVDRVVDWARNCRALVLILDAKYGFISPLDGLGVTELEFVTALRARRPIVVFIGPNADKTADPDQRQFLERVRRFVPGERIFRFTEQNDEVFRNQLQSHRALLEEPGKLPTIAHVDDETRLRWYKRQVQRWLGTVPHPARSQGMPLEQIYLSY